MNEPKQDEIVQVTTRIPLRYLVDKEPEEVRRFLGEHVYRRALLNAGISDAPIEASLA